MGRAGTFFTGCPGPCCLIMNKRFLTPNERELLYISYNFSCADCGVSLVGRTWEAHHIIPFSEGGKTELYNMVPLCPDCHKKRHSKKGKKGEEMKKKDGIYTFPNGKELELRDWQIKARNAWKEKSKDGLRKDICYECCPGAGKTKLSLTLINDLHQEHNNIKTIVLSHTLDIGYQWSEDGCMFGLSNSSKKNDDLVYLEHEHGGVFIVRTYQGLSTFLDRLDLFYTHFPDYRFNVVADEVHHLMDISEYTAREQKEITGWGKKYNELISRPYVVSVISLTGTPWREDGTRIANMSYDKHGVPDTTYVYSMADGIADGILCPINFMGITIPEMTAHVRGKLKHAKTQKEVYELFEKESGLYKSIITEPKNIDYILGEMEGRRIIREKEYGHKVGGLIVCNDIDHGEKVLEMVLMKGFGADIIHSGKKDIENYNIVQSYKKGTLDYLIAIDKIGEGFDAPVCGVIALLSMKRTRRWYQQTLARGQRIHKNKKFCDVLYFKYSDTSLYDNSMNYLKKEQEKGLKEKKEREGTSNKNGRTYVSSNEIGDTEHIFYTDGAVCYYFKTAQALDVFNIMYKEGKSGLSREFCKEQADRIDQELTKKSVEVSEVDEKDSPKSDDKDDYPSKIVYMARKYTSISKYLKKHISKIWGFYYKKIGFTGKPEYSNKTTSNFKSMGPNKRDRLKKLIDADYNKFNELDGVEYIKFRDEFRKKVGIPSPRRRQI